MTEDSKQALEALEELATAIYDEVVRVFNKETGGNQQTRYPLAEQSEAVRKAYFRGAVVANTLVFNRLAINEHKNTNHTDCNKTRGDIDRG